MQARNRSQVYHWRTLTRVYGEYLALIFSLESIEGKERELQPVLLKMFSLYGLWALDKHQVELFQGGFASGGDLPRLLREALLELCAELKGEMVAVVDSLAPTDFVLNSVLGKSNGQVKKIYLY